MENQNDQLNAHFFQKVDKFLLFEQKVATNVSRL